MSRKKDGSIDEKVSGASEMRRRAERRLRRFEHKEPEELTMDEARQLLYELRIHQVELEMQNEELRIAQAEIEESRTRYSDLYDFAPVGYLTMDRKGLIMEANLTACAQLEVERKYIIGKPFFGFVSAEFGNELYRHLMNVVDEDKQQVLELKLKSHRKREFQGLLKSIPWRDVEGNVLCRSSITDITERKLVEEALKKAHDEREILLKEVHHRVKNNFAIVMGLLSMQSMQVKDKRFKDMLKDAQQRIKTMAVVHEKLYQSEDMSIIPMRWYIDGIISDLYDAYGVDKETIRPHLKVEEGLSLGLNKAIPIALIVNELISNSLKYAFPEDRAGDLSVSIKYSGDGRYTLAVGDNGVGLPEDMDFRKTGTLGMHIITLLAEQQLKGEIRLRRKKGTEFLIDFKEDQA